MELDNICIMAEWYFNTKDTEKKAKIKSAFLRIIQENSIDFEQEKNAMERFELRCQHLDTCRRLERLSGRSR